jgi:hypothetical protein
MKKPKRRIMKNFALRNELIQKGFVIPDNLVPKYLKARGFTEAAKAAAVRRGMFSV